MNTVSLDAIGAGLPLAAAVAYLPRTLDVTTKFTCAMFVLSVVISSAFSYCDANAVHVVPGAILLCVSIWLPRARGHNREIPAAMIFALTFISIFPVDIYGAYTCHASSGQARIGGAGFGDSLLHTPLSLSVIHSLIYYFCERDEKRGQVPFGNFLRRQWAFTLGDGKPGAAAPAE
ncbi:MULTISPECIES: hypothetical protein [Caballeronia]|uniref:Transmembrane protein n=1 Tax=Caballeronia zhejiangensis TaxID=871203 RepID=A0A656QA89_9BURK|nr:MULTISPECIES: hypothetical protein [Caballeronia]KDR25563.1 hypothetical protein BG60_27590 [Caballeronia zhejiangensis]MCE4547888.1 hypothetical protein [Caballeronia sp. PC1]MCE4575558.1 hypothetical protein [Caballeronia sp. CLC5]